MTDKAGKVYGRAEHIVSRRVAGEIVLVPTRQATADPTRRTTDLYVLNKTGEYLWELLTDPQSADDLARKLREEYEVTDEAATADVAGFLASLGEIGAVMELEKR